MFTMKLPPLKKKSRNDARNDMDLMKTPAMKDHCYHAYPAVRMSATVSRRRGPYPEDQSNDDTGGLLKRLLTQSWPSNCNRNSGELQKFMESAVETSNPDVEAGIPADLLSFTVEGTRTHLPHPSQLFSRKGRVTKKERTPQTVSLIGDSALRRHVQQLKNKNSLCVSDSLEETPRRGSSVTSKRYRLVSTLNTEQEAPTDDSDTVTMSGYSSRQPAPAHASLCRERVWEGDQTQGDTSFHLMCGDPLMCSTPKKMSSNFEETERDYRPRNLIFEPAEADHPPHFVDMTTLPSGYDESERHREPYHWADQQDFHTQQPDYDPDLLAHHTGHHSGHYTGHPGHNASQPGPSPDLPENGHTYSGFEHYQGSDHAETYNFHSRKRQRQCSQTLDTLWESGTYVNSDMPPETYDYTQDHYYGENTELSKNGENYASYSLSYGHLSDNH